MLANTWKLRENRHRKCNTFLKTKCALQHEYILEAKTFVVKSVYCTTSRNAKLTELLLKVKLDHHRSEGLSRTQWLILRMLKNNHDCTFVHSFIHSFIHSYSALEAGLAGTTAQSRDRYGSGTLHPGQVLGVVCHCFPPPLDVLTFAARCLYVHNDARDPSSETWNCGRETVR